MNYMRPRPSHRSLGILASGSQVLICKQSFSHVRRHSSFLSQQSKNWVDLQRIGARKSKRKLTYSFSSSSQPNGESRGGRIWIALGWTILGLVAIDQALQYKHEQDDKEKRLILAQLQIEADQSSSNVADWDEDLPTLFRCKLRHIDPGLDGTKMLTRKRKSTTKSIRAGDVVEIIDAGVGPSERYHLCRWRPLSNETGTPTVVGWYPIDYLERID